MTPICRGPAVTPRILAVIAAVLLLVSCSRTSSAERVWVDDEVSFDADGLTLHGSSTPS